MSKSTSYTLKKIGLDAICLLAVILPVIYFQNYAKHYQRGFFCDDQSINHPYKDNTITTNLMQIISFGVPGFLMIIGEFLYSKLLKIKSSYLIIGYEIPSWMLMAYNKIGIFAFGTYVNFLIVHSGKCIIGRLRPHFLEVCQPNISCNKNNTFEYFKKYHTDFVCTNKKYEHEWIDSRLSFPSGHSADSMYGMLFLALYFQLRITWKGSKLLRHLLQVICLWTSWFIAMSRISDYKHHWSDVLAGMSIGAINALIHVFCIADFFKERRLDSRDQGIKIEEIECDDITIHHVR